MLLLSSNFLCVKCSVTRTRIIAVKVFEKRGIKALAKEGEFPIQAVFVLRRACFRKRVVTLMAVLIYVKTRFLIAYKDTDLELHFIKLLHELYSTEKLMQLIFPVKYSDVGCNSEVAFIIPAIVGFILVET